MGGELAEGMGGGLAEGWDFDGWRIGDGLAEGMGLRWAKDWRKGQAVTRPSWRG